MRRKIKYSVIGETASLLKQDLDELRSSRNQLLNDVDTINDGYKGQDANLLIAKYKEKVANIDNYIQYMEKIQIVLDWLSENYNNSHSKAKNNLKTFLTADGVEKNNNML